MADPRNTVALPAPLFEAAARAAREHGVDVDEWVTRCVRTSLAAPAAPPPGTPPADGPDEPDPLWTDTDVFEDDGPTDMAARHDDYLYGPFTKPGSADGADRP